jgi:putative transposase
MAHPKTTSLASTLATLLPRERVEAEARRLGVVTRQRKVDVLALVWALVLGFQVGTERTLEALRHAYQQGANQSIARSAFHDRLTAQLALLLHNLASVGLETLAGAIGVPPGCLAGFRDLLAIDATVLRLHDWLSRNYAACRTNHTKAAAKLHLVLSVLSGTPHKVKLTPERTNDRTPWKRIGGWVRGMLLLFDLGYFSYHLFALIAANGGFFLTRMKANANPLIVAAHRRWRGRSIPVVGRHLREVLASLQRQVLDVEVEVSFARRAYRGRRSMAAMTFRLIAILNPETGAYHCYLTNIPAADLRAEDVTAVYALRWQVELFFKAMKHHGHLDQLPTRKPSVVECLVWASVLATLASQTLYRLVRQAIPAQRYIPLLRWASLFGRSASGLLNLALGRLTRDEAAHLLALLLREAPDPNCNRRDRAVEKIQGHARA